MLSNTKCSFPRYTQVIALSITLFLLFGCQDASLPASAIQVHGETGALTNLTEIFFDANLTPLDNNQAKLDSYYLTATVYIPVCGYAGGVEVFVYSEGKLIYKKDGMQKAVFEQPIPVLSVLPSFDIKQTFVPESTVIVTRGDAYIELVYFTEIGQTHKIGPTEICEYMISSGPDFGPNTGPINFGPNTPSTPSFSSGTLRIDIPLESENQSQNSVTATPTSTLQDCESPNITDLIFMPSSPAVIGTVVDITGVAKWNACFRSMRLKIDDDIVYELGLPSFTYSWDTSDFTPGKHTITLEVAAQGDNSWSAPSVLEANFSLEGGVSAPTPTQITSELPPLNRQDYYSVLQWIKYAMANNDVSVFEKLTPGDLTQLIDEVNASATLKRAEFLSGLSKRLPNKPQCDFYILSDKRLTIQTNTWSPEWEMKEFCHLSCSPMNPPLLNSSIVFSLELRDVGWAIDIMGFEGHPESTNPSMRLYPKGERVSCGSVSISSTTVSVPVSSELPPLDNNDYYSVLQWIKYAFANNYMDVFKELVTGDLAYVSYIEGSDPVTRGEFLDTLERRLPSRPHCDSFMIYSDSSGDRLDILSTGWSPEWVMDQLCHAGCDKLSPPATTDVIAFSLLNKGDGWRFAVIPFGERPDWFAGTLRTQVISCDTVQTMSSVSSTAISSDLPPLNRAEYFSVLQWIKYGTLNNDISVFEQLIVGNSIQLVDGNGEPVNISKTDFLAELSARLTSKPNCEFFMFEESGRLVIRISNWSPSWDVGNSTVAYLILELKNNQWVLGSIMYGNNPPSWADGLERISFDTISISAGNTIENACQEARPTRLKIGDFAFVSFYPPLNQRVRSGPGTSNSILDVIPVGSAVKILDGPECADNWVWWKVRVLSSKLEGWTSEGDADAYWLIPCASRAGCGTQ